MVVGDLCCSCHCSWTQLALGYSGHYLEHTPHIKSVPQNMLDTILRTVGTTDENWARSPLQRVCSLVEERTIPHQ